MTEIAPANTDIYDIANRLWETADELRANSHLKAAEYSIPVLGLIFLKFADSRFARPSQSWPARAPVGGRSARPTTRPRRPVPARAIPVRKPPRLKEGDNLGKAINDAMAAIEDENPALKGVLPRTYQSLTNDTLVSLLRSVNAILGEIEGDAFGKVYEYFLGKFAIAEGAKGGEYFTPTLDRSPDRRNHRAVQRQDPGSCMWLRRNVRPERKVRRRAPQRQHGAGCRSTGRSESRRHSGCAR